MSNQKTVKSKLVVAEKQQEQAKKADLETSSVVKKVNENSSSDSQNEQVIVPSVQKSDVHIYDTIVVGAGISGIAAAYKMNQAGYHDYVVLEKADRVGGTWRDNNYPGCGCDVPSALYSFSFSPSHKWSHLFAKQPEILSYL